MQQCDTTSAIPFCSFTLRPLALQISSVGDDEYSTPYNINKTRDDEIEQPDRSDEGILTNVSTFRFSWNCGRIFFFLSFYLSHCFLGIHDEVLELQIVQAKRENQKKEHEASVTGVREREREREIDGIFFLCFGYLSMVLIWMLGLLYTSFLYLVWKSREKIISEA